MGRTRKKHKDMPAGFEVDRYGGWSFRPTNKATLRTFERLYPGRKSIKVSRDKTEARKWWAKRFIESDGEQNAAAGTLDELLWRFEREELPTMHPKTASDAGRYLARLRAEFGATKYPRTLNEAMKPDVLRAMHLTQYLRRQADRPVAANREIKLLSRVFHVARAVWGMTECNPALGVIYNPEVPRDQYIDDTTYQRVYDVATPLLQCMMDLAQMHGPRRGMLIRITLADVTEAGLWLTMNKRKKGERAKRQLVQWTPDLRAVIDRALELRSHARGGQKQVADSAHAPLLLNRDGKRVTETGFNSLWARALERAGVPRGQFHFHDLRAKAGSDAESDQDAQAMLGHDDPSTTKRVYRRRHTVVTPLARIGGKK